MLCQLCMDTCSVYILFFKLKQIIVNLQLELFGDKLLKLKFKKVLFVRMPWMQLEVLKIL